MSIKLPKSTSLHVLQYYQEKKKYSGKKKRDNVKELFVNKIHTIFTKSFSSPQQVVHSVS